MLKNNPIRNNIDTIGFLLMITNTPQSMEAKDISNKKLGVELLVKLSFNKNKSDM